MDSQHSADGPESALFLTHTLEDGSQFFSGVLPEGDLRPDNLFEELWKLHGPQRQVTIHGKRVLLPRFDASYGADYEYSGQTTQAEPIPTILRRVLEFCRREICPTLNGLLLNFYDGPTHYIGQHRDKTKTLRPDSSIVTIALGEERVFRLTHLRVSGNPRHDFPMPDGSVFIIPLKTNQTWYHGIPKSTRYSGRRISITVRSFLTGIVSPYFAD